MTIACQGASEASRPNQQGGGEEAGAEGFGRGQFWCGPHCGPFRQTGGHSGGAAQEVGCFDGQEHRHGRPAASAERWQAQDQCSVGDGGGRSSAGGGACRGGSPRGGASRTRRLAADVHCRQTRQAEETSRLGCDARWPRWRRGRRRRELKLRRQEQSRGLQAPESLLEGQSEILHSDHRGPDGGGFPSDPRRTWVSGARSQHRAWLEHRSKIMYYPTTIRFAWMLGGIHESMRRGAWEEARARTCLALAAADQAAWTVDHGC